MYQNINVSTLISNCKECGKFDVCKYTSEFNKIKKEVDKIEKESGSPVVISVTCRSSIKNTNTRDSFSAKTFNLADGSERF